MAFVVLIDDGEEGVVFKDKKDALYAATGEMNGFHCSTLADAFRETYAYDEPKKQFEMREISLSAIA